MAETFHLSEDALKLLRLRLVGRRVEVTDETRGFYRELAAAGLAEPVSGFAGGAEAHFRITKEACDRREEWLTPVPGRPR